MQHFELKCSEKIKAIAWQPLVKERSNEEKIFIKLYKPFIGELPENNWVKNLKDLLPDALYLMQVNQTFFQHISMTVHYFSLN